LVFAALGGACRYEALLGVFAGGLFLARGRKLVPSRVMSPVAGGIAMLIGAALSLVLTLGLRRALGTPAEITTSTYTFYTFYDGLPSLLWPKTFARPGMEYGRYAASMALFGSFDDNGGSLLRALLSHPSAAVLRFLAKPIDLLGVLSWIQGVTPLGMILALIGVRSSRRARQNLWPLLPFGCAAIPLFAPPAAPDYFLVAVFPVLACMARGIDTLIEAWPARRVRTLALASMAAGAVLVATLGKTEASTSRAVVAAGRYLEDRCKQGCLVNFLPLALRSQIWAEVEAGAPIPHWARRSESFVLGHFPAGFEAACSFEDRKRRARESGFTGPILDVEIDVKSANIWLDISPEHSLEGPKDTSSRRSEASFEDGPDRVEVFLVSSAD
jgi:hypothetical protein